MYCIHSKSRKLPLNENDHFNGVKLIIVNALSNENIEFQSTSKSYISILSANA
jgi:hypothetical protein